MNVFTFEAARILIPFITSFAVGILLTPVVTHYLYKHKVWKKKAGKTTCADRCKTRDTTSIRVLDKSQGPLVYFPLCGNGGACVPVTCGRRCLTAQVGSGRSAAW